MSCYFNFRQYPYAETASFFDFSNRFTCGPTCCTVTPTAPANGVGVFDRPCASAVQPWQLPASCAWNDQYNRGPIGWAEVGYVVSNVDRCDDRADSRPSFEDWQPNHRRRNRNGRRSVARSAVKQTFVPRQDHLDKSRFCCKEDENCKSDADNCGACDNRRCSPLAVECRVRRYRLYARPAHGWCGSYNVSQWQYAVTEEGVDRCNAILIVLRDDRRHHGHRGNPYNPQSLVWQELQTGDVVHVPGELCSFRVHLYADDRAF